MRSPIKSVFPIVDKSNPGEKFTSYDKIATALRARYGNCCSSFTKLTDRSLGRKIALLDGGDGTWWRNRPDATGFLVELLDVDLDDLPLSERARHNLFKFDAFPELPALDLMREVAWTISEPKLLQDDEHYHTNNMPTLNSWLEVGIRPYERNVEWLYVQDEFEYKLLTSKLDKSGGYDVLGSKLLRDVMDNDIERVRHHEPLILAIQDNATHEEVQALIQYRQDAPLLIISLLQQPTTFNQDEIKKDTTRKIRYWAWTLLPNWRELILDWIQHRLFNDKNSQFSKGGTEKLLNKLDPGRILFDNVTDFLVLCKAVYDFGETKINVDVNDSQLLSIFNSDKSRSDLLPELIKNRWEHWELPWKGELPQADWMALTKDSCQFETLVTGQLITPGRDDDYDFQKPIVVRLLLRSYLSKKLIDEIPESWSPACFDSARRPLIDAALDEIVEIKILEKIAEKLMQKSVSASNIGAGEALFAAIGRRLIHKKEIGKKLPRFASLIIKQLWCDEENPEFLMPWSRSLAKRKNRMEWVSICWAWSLVPEARTDLPTNWLFPGWYETLPKNIPLWMNAIRTNRDYTNDSWGRTTVQMEEFLMVFNRLAEKFEQPPAYENMPPLFYAGLLARAALGQWPASSSWWSYIIGIPPAEQALLNLVGAKDLTKNEKLSTALNWWPSLVQHQRKTLMTNPITRSRLDVWHSAILDWVMSVLKAHSEQALNELEDDDRKFLAQNPKTLPLPFKQELLKWLAKYPPLDWHPIARLDLLAHYGKDVTLNMEPFLSDNLFGKQAAACLWEWEPGRAERLLNEDLTQVAMINLILSCPNSALGTAIESLKRNPQLLQAERLSWARRHLPDARQHAQALIQLIRTQ